MSYIFLSSPYSHPDAEVRHQRYLAAERALAFMLKRGAWAYSPIVHCHAISIAHRLPTDFDFWADFSMAMLRPADQMWILMLPGWEDSVGIAAEQGFALGNGIPIVCREPSWFHDPAPVSGP